MLLLIVFVLQKADYNFSTCSHVCDIGGGVGTVAIELIRNNPQAKATILDLPFAEKNALEYFELQGLNSFSPFLDSFPLRQGQHRSFADRMECNRGQGQSQVCGRIFLQQGGHPLRM